MMNDDLRGALQRVNDRMAELFKNAQGARRGERDFTPEDVRQPRETMDALAPIVAQSYELRRRQPELGEPLDLYKSHLNGIADHGGADTRAAGATSDSPSQPIAAARRLAVGGNLLTDTLDGYPRARFFTCFASFSACSEFFTKETDKTVFGSAD